MISAFGAILLIAAGGYAGFSALEHLRTALRSAETILDASRDMRTEILCHRTPLPQLLERLGARYPRLFHDAENACMLVREFSFLSVWTASIRCAALPKPLEEPLLRLGTQLSSGAEPEQALDAFFYVREYFEMKKKPSTSELLDWISALRLSGLPVDSLRRDLPLLSFLIKKDEDLEDVKKSMGGLR